PAPPYSSGIHTPSRFKDAIFFNTEGSKCCFSSHSLMNGATSFCVNSRTVCTSARWSSVSSKSIISLLFPIRYSKRPDILPERTRIARMLCYTPGMPNKRRAGEVVTVGLVQMTCDPEPEKNLKKAIAGINNAAKGGAQIVCLQELFRSQYFCQTEDIQLFKLAETIPGPSTEALGKIARQRKVVIVASL